MRLAAARMRARTVARRGTLAGWDWAIPAGLIAALLAPMVLTSRTFGQDWPNHLWLVWQQGRNVSALGHPSYFLDSNLGALYPIYAFYGGTLYAVAGTLSALLGNHATVAYVAVFAASFVAAFAGCTWLSLELGLRGWRAQILGVIYVASAYYLTSAYGRGDFPELVATSALPVVIASALHLLRRPSLAPLPVAVFALAAVVMTGSHAITLVWGTTFLVALAVVTAVAFSARGLPRGRPLVVAGVFALSVGVNLWFLLPAAAYHGKVGIGRTAARARELGGGAQNRAQDIFDPLRTNALGPHPLLISPTNARVPVVALAWAMLALAAGWPRLPRSWRRVAVGLAVILIVLLALIMFHQPWALVPTPWRYVQFTIRLQTYVTLAVAGLVVVGILAVQSMRRGRARAALMGAVAAVGVLTVAQGVVQAWTVPSVLPSRDTVFRNAHAPPSSWYAQLDYADASAPIVGSTLGPIAGLTTGGGPNSLARVTLPVDRPRAGYSFTYVSPGPGTIPTNVATGTYLVKVTGARPVGRSPDGTMVLALGDPPGRVSRLAFSVIDRTPIGLGLAGTVVSVLGLVTLLGVLARRRRTPRGTRAGPGVSGSA